MPVVSKQEYFAHLLNPLAGRRTELTLLTLCMQLCCTAAVGHDEDRLDVADLYQTAKRFHFELETSGALSIYVLQAAVLTAVYEVGQAIYPAAYLTAGACARYGLALGVDKICLNQTGSDAGSFSWVQIEERRRVWWAILMLDR